MRRILKNKYWIWIIVLLFLAAMAAAAYGLVPIMKIDGANVSFAEYFKTYSAIQSYDRIAKQPVASDTEIKKQALEIIVENRFLDILTERADADLKNEAAKLVEESIQSTRNLSLDEASQKIYGLSEADFKRLVLIPQAEKDLLTKHYENNPGELANLWNDLIKNSQVKIYYPGFYWDGEVKIKK